MKLKVYDIRVDGCSYALEDDYQAIVPDAKHLPRVIELLSEYGMPETTECALETYIRSNIFYSNSKLTYKIDLLKGDEQLEETVPQPLYADIVYEDYTDYQQMTVRLELPPMFIITENMLLNSACQLEDAIHEILAVYLPMTITL